MPRVHTVLLVEDDPAWAMLTREAFAEAAPQVSVEWCSTGSGALARLALQPWPAAVLLDLNLPDLSGLDVLRALGAQPGFCSPVVVLSASRAAADRSAVARVGAAEYRLKPTTYSELRDLAAQIAAGRIGDDELRDPEGSPDDVGIEGSLGGSEQP